MTHTQTDDRLVLNVPDVMRMLDVSRKTVEKLIREGKLRSYKVESLRKVDRQAVLDYLASVQEQVPA